MILIANIKPTVIKNNVYSNQIIVTSALLIKVIYFYSTVELCALYTKDTEAAQCLFSKLFKIFVIQIIPLFI